MISPALTHDSGQRKITFLSIVRRVALHILSRGMNYIVSRYSSFVLDYTFYADYYAFLNSPNFERLCEGASHTYGGS
jgi:hypothetical protein